MVVRRTAGSLETAVAAQVEIKLVRMANLRVHHSTRQNVAAGVRLVGVGEEDGVVPLLHDDVRDFRGVLGVRSAHLVARLLQQRHLLANDRLELGLRHAVAVHDEALGLLAAVVVVKVAQQPLESLLQPTNDFHVGSARLHRDARRVARGGLVQAAHHGGDGARVFALHHRVCDVRAQNHEGLGLEVGGDPRQGGVRAREEGHVLGGGDEAVDSTQLGVDLQRHVGQVLIARATRRVPDVGLLRQQTLRRHAELAVALKLHLLVAVRARVWQNHQNQLAPLLVPLRYRHVGLRHERRRRLVPVAIQNRRRGFHVQAALLHYSLEVAQEGVERPLGPVARVGHTILLLQHHDGPAVELRGLVQLAVLQVPGAPLRQQVLERVGARVLVRHHGRRQHARLHLQHLGVHLEPKLGHQGVGVDAGFLHHLLHRPHALRRLLGRVQNDGGRLRRLQLAAPLPGLDNAHLHGQAVGLVFGPHIE
mmetsp:Transcript_16847/g.32283  ORF Transcript_16847/g.32283 Transcript_16847/m.32283 type:complete len:478 (-) Transcript_16847:1075-2508(-)